MSVLFLPALPVSLNDWSRAHWSMRKRERDRWDNIVGAVLLRHPFEPMLGPVRLCMTFYWPDRQRRDAANGGKLVLDAIVRAGLIRDDGPPWLTEETYRSRLAPAPDRTGTVVQIHQDDAPAWPLPVQRKRKRPPLGVQGGASRQPAARQGTLSAAGLRDLARSGLVRLR